MKKILIVGATSAIAEATARRFAAQGATLLLLARDRERLQLLATDLEVRGAAAVHTLGFDAATNNDYPVLVHSCIETLGGLDQVLIAHGTLSDQKACEQSVDLTLRELTINAFSVIALLTELAKHFEAQNSGCIAVIGSVAGDRGRQSNYVYGTAKGALSLFLQGLRNRFGKSGVQVLTIKPGFVDTPMTAAFPKGPLWASPEKVAADIEKAIAKGRDVLYTPGFWLPIMVIIRLLPERLFKKLSL
ncbi:TPA: SDR family oxidoreductase [Pseudomonas aeruginosa]|uniref:Short-chain dehydrogenase/reductase SDR n=1 Tax=Pseudomonas paraeruginosa (strain DSM 24068 / PA7) TaxID=381754 RepID=A6VES5_PSEP7|nr:MULTISPECIES: SDR family oxidoreductase [Pseudomonas aeruginosa group]VTS49148.1 short chain dehydrogenase/reductase family oxidoreductase [Streptococcus dysgalactiae subsp. equisimilis]ABR83255.1 short-chain dehydrogenase/reductase SDR [Pseudomonas aeruginosa PA7]KRU92624.1 short-chain dehydrogenase [Pseudomonas aeruginosa]KSC80560.1 short-chain dehydrogenase [Pseudomonas aeruginosa]KSD09599.1 short-chain dehydrogenase [Pseudomonas aeruginosa]